jgi:hypothetical protein
MTSLFAQLFLALQEKIKTDIPEIRWIDQDLGQLEDYDTRPPVSFPCVLIDFNETTYEEMNQRRQQANITFTLRLGFPSFSYAANTAPQSVRELALQYYELEQRLFEAVQGFDGGGIIQGCTRQSTTTEGRKDDNLRVRVMTFTAMSEDASAQIKYTKAPRPRLTLIEDICSTFGIEGEIIGETFQVN